MAQNDQKMINLRPEPAGEDEVIKVRPEPAGEDETIKVRLEPAGEDEVYLVFPDLALLDVFRDEREEIGRASCRERV